MALTIVDALAPLVSDARGLVELRRSLWTAYPAADSPAMAERVDEAKLADTWHDLPVTAAQNYIAMLVLVAEDHLECMCRLLDRPGWVPVWGLAPCARALLEAAGRAVDIGEVGIGARSRVERYMNERLFALDQMSNLPAGAKDAEGVTTQRKEIIDSGLRKRFTRRPHPSAAKAAAGSFAVPPQFGTGRPGDMAVVRRLFEATPELGKGSFQWFSAATHSTAWEVEKPFKAISTNNLGQTEVQLGREPGQVHQFLHTAILGYIEMATRFLLLWGVSDEAWLSLDCSSGRLTADPGGTLTSPGGHGG